MIQVSPTKCACRSGLDLVKGKGCFEPHITPKPVPNVPRCDPRTTRGRGDRCSCLYKGMVQVSPTSCACKRGTKLVPAKAAQDPLSSQDLCQTAPVATRARPALAEIAVFALSRELSKSQRRNVDVVQMHR